MKYLHEQFLQDPQEYALNGAFYTQLIQTITGSEPVPFFQMNYGNGDKMHSDHIFSTKYNNRILQIIQREPTSAQPMIRVRVQRWADEQEMLVLTLELSEEVKAILERVVKAWLMEGASEEEIKIEIHQTVV
jgi:hypothetical protein